MPSNTVTLSMIVKNEERFLEQCLLSVMPYVDHTIVVDTGSTDRTVDIAKKHGCEVRHFEWINDFSAARNESIRDVKTTWLLILDADEILAPGHGERLKEELLKMDEAGMDGGLMYLHNALTPFEAPGQVLAGARRMGDRAQVPRILRNGPGIQFKGAMHEDTSEWLMDRGMKVFFSSVEIVHFGANQEVSNAKNKRQRNIEMLQARILKEPTNVTMYGYLALELLNNVPDEETYAVCQAGFEQIEKDPEAGTLTRLGPVKALLEHRKGDLDTAFYTIEKTFTIDGPNPDTDFVAGLLYETKALQPETDGYNRVKFLLEAAQYYQFALNQLGYEVSNTYIGGSNKFLAASRLGWTLYYLGKYPEAQFAFKKALEYNPALEDAVTGLATVEAVLSGQIKVEQVAHEETR